MKIIYYIIGLFACLWLGYWIGQRKNIVPTEKITETIIKRDTITKTDTLIKEIISPKYIREEIVRIDTIKADTTLIYQRRTYLTQLNEDSISGEIKAVVSGYNAVLDTLQYNLIIPTKTITNTVETQITKYKQKHWNFTVGVGAGYGVLNRKADIFVGGMVGYSF